MKRTLKKQLKVFSAEGGFSVLRMETREHAERLVLREALRPEFDQVTGELIGYRVLGIEVRRVDSDLTSIRSTAGISGPNPQTHAVGEMELNCERSRTEGCSESRRMELQLAGFAPEDRVERVRAKVRVYAQIGPARGDVLRVWPRQNKARSI